MTRETAELFSERDAIRAARAAYVRDCLRSERWSTRAAAMALGTNHTSLGSRLRADTSFLAEEIESIATLLKRDPIEFYAAYLAAGNEKGPTSEEAGPDVHPLGLEPRTHWIRDDEDNLDDSHEKSARVTHVDFARKRKVS